jgi:hypothetical protein
MELTWKAIGSVIWEKIFGSSRASELNKQTQIVINEWRGLYEEKKKLVADYENQIEKIKEFKKAHPENGKELDAWRDREYALMMELVKAKEEVSFWRERAIFLEKENESLLMKQEKLRIIK